VVIAISDANLDRYGIRPDHLAKAISKDPRVSVFLILIGSLGEQARRLESNLPGGKAFICSKAEQLPNIMQQIFAAKVVT
jgi:hypothetical protein